MISPAPAGTQCSAFCSTLRNNTKSSPPGGCHHGLLNTAANNTRRLGNRTGNGNHAILRKPTLHRNKRGAVVLIRLNNKKISLNGCNSLRGQQKCTLRCCYARARSQTSRGATTIPDSAYEQPIARYRWMMKPYYPRRKSQQGKDNAHHWPTATPPRPRGEKYPGDHLDSTNPGH